MASRRLEALLLGRDDDPVPRLLPRLERALAGFGPAVLPVDAAGPEAQTLVAEAAPAEPLESLDIAAVVPTSGSTGGPRLVLLPGAAMRASAASTHRRLGGPGHWLLALPVTRVAGLQVLVRSVLSGTAPEAIPAGSTVDGFVAGTDRLAASSRRYTALVATQLRRLLDDGPASRAALESYDAVLVGGGRVEAALLDRARSAGVPVVSTYGLTETCGGCVYDGWALDQVEVSVDGEARIAVRGPVVFAGYRRRPELTAATLVEGWCRTDDVGFLDAAGRLTVTGRRDDVVVSGGVNVALPAVEETLRTHGAVTDAVVVGVDDPEWGTRVVAYVTVVDPPHPPEAVLREYVGARHPRAWVPRSVTVLESLPRLALGKPDRAALRRWAQDSAAAPGA